MSGKEESERERKEGREDFWTREFLRAATCGTFDDWFLRAAEHLGSKRKAIKLFKTRCVPETLNRGSILRMRCDSRLWPKAIAEHFLLHYLASERCSLRRFKFVGSRTLDFWWLVRALNAAPRRLRRMSVHLRQATRLKESMEPLWKALALHPLERLTVENISAREASALFRCLASAKSPVRRLHLPELYDAFADPIPEDEIRALPRLEWISTTHYDPPLLEGEFPHLRTSELCLSLRIDRSMGRIASSAREFDSPDKTEHLGLHLVAVEGDNLCIPKDWKNAMFKLGNLHALWITYLDVKATPPSDLESCLRLALETLPRLRNVRVHLQSDEYHEAVHRAFSRPSPFANEMKLKLKLECAERTSFARRWDGWGERLRVSLNLHFCLLEGLCAVESFLKGPDCGALRSVGLSWDLSLHGASGAKSLSSFGGAELQALLGRAIAANDWLRKLQLATRLVPLLPAASANRTLSHLVLRFSGDAMEPRMFPNLRVLDCCLDEKRARRLLADHPSLCQIRRRRGNRSVQIYYGTKNLHPASPWAPHGRIVGKTLVSRCETLVPPGDELVGPLL